MGVINNTIGLRGEVILELVDVETGEVVERKHHNLITTAGLGRVAELLANVAGKIAPTHIAVGTGADQEYAETNQDADKDLTSSGADQKLAQGFQLSTARTVPRVLLWLKRIGTSAGTLTVRIETDSGGDPSGTLVTNGQSSAVAINGLETTYDWVAFDFATSPSLAGSTQYHIVLQSSGYTYDSGVTEVNWGVDESAPGYASGALRTYNGSAWSAASPAADGCFRVNADPKVGDTTIVDEIDRNVITSQGLQGAATARMLALFGTAEAVDRLGMAGLFDDPTTGTMIAAAPVDIKKTSAQRLNVYWQITAS